MTSDLVNQLQNLQNVRELLGEETYHQGLNKLRDRYGVETVNALLQHPPLAPPDDHISAPHSQGFVDHPTGTVDQTFGNATVHRDSYGQTIGVNLGLAIFGRDPREEERTHLVAYLERLAAKFSTLPMRGLAEKLDQRSEGVALPAVYTMLATAGNAGVMVATTAEAGVDDYFADQNWRKKLQDHHSLRGVLKEAYDREYALPSHAIVSLARPSEALSTTPVFVLRRALLATEAVHQHRRCVLLGAPGSGKSTFLRHLAWALAQRGLDCLTETTRLHGWEEAQRILPVFLPLRTLAGRLRNRQEHEWDRTVSTALQEAMAQYDYDPTDAIGLLRESLRRGVALLLLDGLDEVPMEATAGTADRLTTLQAVRSFTRLYPDTRAVVTCRTRAFSDDLRECLGWSVETLAPFTMGQVRHFVPAWYGELAEKTELTHDQAARMAKRLVATVANNERLRTMAATPLLLTMMSLVLYNKGELPRDRPTLYEHLLNLLLGQWDRVKYDEHRLSSLGEAIGRPSWTSDYLRPLLDKLSYEAHTTATSEDGRGRLTREQLFTSLYDFFVGAGMSAREAGQATPGFLEYIDHRSGLLAPDENNTYVFAHLTLQEYCAGRHMVTHRDPVRLVMQHRDDDRWREPIFLGLGVAQETNPFLIESILRKLIDRDEENTQKPADRWQRDLILAAEIGNDRDWDYLRQQRVDVAPIQRDLRSGLAALLNDPAQPLPAAERVRAGFLLGDLGDPRFPITIEEWQKATRGRQLRVEDQEPEDLLHRYWCYVPPGPYMVGSHDNDPDAEDKEKPQHTVTIDYPFWVARYLVTNAQWQAWVAQGGRQSFLANDSNLNHPNQPVVGVRWSWFNQFCAWLTEQMAGVLPVGYAVQLPTEAEWEAAARGGDARCYPWGDDWRNDHATTEENREDLGTGYSTPVGCYAAGAAPCGALDMAGNLWEWSADGWRSHPGAAVLFEEQIYRVVKGGSCYQDRIRVRCAARFRPHRGYVDLDYGGRVVVSPRVQTSGNDE